MTDWLDATDPVQPVRERERQANTIGERMSCGKRRKWRPQRLSVERQPWVMDEDFDQMEA